MTTRRQKVFRYVGIPIAGVVMLLIALIGSIDRTPLEQQEFYRQAMTALDTLPLRTGPINNLKTGWAKVNITPNGQMPMAGYMKRNHYEAVHDSLYARIIKLETGGQSVVLLNADLLLFPPALKEQLNEKLQAKGLNIFLYLSATHTHNGIGAWDESLVGQYALGEFDYKWINATADALVNAIQNIEPIPASIQYWESDADELVVNRIAHSKGKKDGKLRGFILERVDSSKACLFTFSAHATTLTKENLSLSADYPAAVIKNLEESIDFGMFMAGMVGSHAFKPMPPEREFELVDKEGAMLSTLFAPMHLNQKLDSVSIYSAHAPITFGPSQLRIGKDWKVRNWAFRSVLGGLEGELTYLRIGNILLIGTPCDFSGEISVNEKLAEYAKSKGLNLIITSFNGNYVGYITHDRHYDSINRTEIREMNWVGPYYGRYFSEMIKKLIDKSAGD